MSKLYLSFVQKSFKYYIFIFFIFDIDASAEIDITELLTEIEVVSKFEDRRKGLMSKSSIPKNYGMFFIWEYKRQQCMWMKDTSIPLSVAYIGNKGEILEIYDMVPFSKKSVCSENYVQYALEVNKDWFEKNNINIGDVINIKDLVLNDN
mgnify:CR=1 FL=1|tara:strand:+ start:656 stop:1105 length:450 start_codon:yes stop_codon:yes gene_type:complete